MLSKQWRCFGGWVKQFTHQSAATNCEMRFTVFVPPQAEASPVPALYYLSGLTCTDDNFTHKAGAQRYAAEHGLLLVAPDTSPRGLGLAGEDESYDFGSGAGFYVDATEQPWAGHYNMHAYITQELPGLVEAHLPVVPGLKSVMGHSMGGHGALVCAFRDPAAFASVSAFAPICHPTQCAWGQKAFAGYLGDSPAAWAEYDAALLVRERGPFVGLDVLVDQGAADDFLGQGQLQPEALQAACEEKGQALELRMQEGYDHSYFFISTFVGEHIAWHAERLQARASS